MRRADSGVSALSSPGNTHRLSSSAIAMYRRKKTCRRPSASSCIVPAASAISAKTPIGAARATAPAIRMSTSSATCRIGSKVRFPDVPISAAPSAKLNTTTAGMMVFVREKNGLVGTYSSMKSSSRLGSTRLALKKVADSHAGSANEMPTTAASPIPQNSGMNPPPRTARVFASA